MIGPVLVHEQLEGLSIVDKRIDAETVEVFAGLSIDLGGTEVGTGVIPVVDPPQREWEGASSVCEADPGFGSLSRTPPKIIER